jgi:MFS transporter, PCFT/HCP family, solute carrier family 46, member 3
VTKAPPFQSRSVFTNNITLLVLVLKYYEIIMATMKEKIELQTDLSAVKDNGVVNEKPVKEPFSLTRIIRNFLAFFTVEPYLICYFLPSVICSVGLLQLNMEKACRVDLNYTEEICSKVVAGDTSDNTTTEALIGASTLVADMTAWKDPLQTGVPAILILFIGAWSDRTGNRKVLLLVPIIGEILSMIGLIIATYYFLECPLWVVGLLQALSSTFTGGLPIALMGSYSYIADVTTPESRTFRIGVVAVIVTLGIPLGTAISGVLTEEVGYYGIFGIAIALYVIGFVHTWFRVHDIRNTEIEGTFLYKLGQFFHPRNVWDTISLLFLSRGKMLAQIILVIWAHIVIMGPVVGK